MLKICCFFDKTMYRFAVVGVANTLFGTAVMLICYNFFDFSYWVSSAANYVAGSVLSYFLNKKYTFGYGEKDWSTVWRFAINIVFCYFVAYNIAKPLVMSLLSCMEKTVQENVALLTGTVFFVVINYLGQRYFVFRKKEL